MRNQLSSQWPKRHALAAPWGTALATWLLTVYYEPGASFAEMVSMGAMIYGMVISALELGVPMAFYAYEKIKNERARRREQQEELRRQSRAEGMAEGMDLVIAKFSENPDLSPEELKKVVIDDLKNNGRKNGDGSSST